MADRPVADSPPRASPDAGTLRDFDETLGRAIDADRLEAALAAADSKLAGVFAAHQKLESLFTVLNGGASPPNHFHQNSQVR